MTRILLSVFLFSFFVNASAQDAPEASVEGNVFGVQAGVIGVWIQDELGLSKSIALRSELGYEMAAVTANDGYEDKTEFLGSLTFSIGPRWYYNLERRVKKGKNISKNSGNHFGVKIFYIPDLLTTKTEDVRLVSSVATVINWGIRRVYGKHFTFETSAGVGPNFAVGANTDSLDEKVTVFPDLQVRIGYTF